MAVNTYLRNKKDNDDGEDVNRFFDKCFVCGTNSLNGLHLTNKYYDGKAHLVIVPDERMIGLALDHGGLMHGGFTAMIFDECFYYACRAGLDLDVVTLNMDIDFKSPAPIGHRLKATCWVTKQEGKKIFLEGTFKDGEREVAHAKALYISLDLEKFLDEADKMV